MKNTKILVKTKSKIYPVYFGSEILSRTGSLINKYLPDVKKVCIISDKKIPLKFLKKITNSLNKYNTNIYKISTSEKVKNLNTANKIIETLLKKNYDRSDCVIAFGGGIIGDLASLVANLTKRGLNFINIPSTLLSQVDASIGGKTAVNSKQGKNLIGTFYQPTFILTDTTLLKSLPNREIINGYAEILKHSLILDRSFFLWLYKNAKKTINNRSDESLKKIIIKSCKIKSSIVNKDEKEKNLRMILNFGHTFAHGFEGASNFSKKLNHGEAVLLGMMAACKLALDRRKFQKSDLSLLETHYKDLELPLKINKFFKKKNINKIIYFMKKDKKNFNKKINIILIKKIGKADKPGKFTVNQGELKKFFIKNYF